MNAFEVLGLKPCLVIGREELNRVFREAGKWAHPDAGGSEEAFARLQAAVDILQSPARRLKTWLEFKGLEVNARGSISNQLMDEFARVGKVTQHAEALIRKREAAQSALARAMLENETQLCREQVELCQSRIEMLVGGIVGKFTGLEGAEVALLEPALEWYRDLTFLEKWQASLRAIYTRLM